MKEKIMEVITFATIKGGIGKTTLSYNYGEYLASKGHKVLLMDLDQQSSLSRTYGITDQEGTVEEIFNVYNDDENRKEVKIHHVNKNVDLISGTTRLDKVQSRLETHNNKNLILFMWLHQHYDDIVANYDYMIIDCHPDIGIATKNAIAVSDAVLSPVTPSKFSYDSITELETRMKELKKETVDVMSGNTLIRAKVYYIANMIKHNTGISKDFLKSIKEDKEVEWIAEIPEREIFNRSTYYQIPICEMEQIANTPLSEISDDYKNNKDFMKMRNYFASQNPKNYKQIDDIFDTITKYV